MKPINSKLHGILDYATALVLVFPFVTNYYAKHEDTWILGLTGGIVAIYSLFTNYEFGIIRLIPLKLHLALDVIVGLGLILVSWLYPLPHFYLYWPAFLGAASILIVILSSTVPFVVTRRDLDITKP